MELLYLLFGIYIISSIIIRVRKGEFDHSLSGRIAMSAMLLLTASGHFIFPEGMAKMIPDFIPFRIFLVYLTGILEFLAAIGLIIDRYSRVTSVLLIIFFIAILPANINAAINNIDLRTGDNSGPGIEYLYFRIPMQLLFIGWTYLFGLKLNRKDLKEKAET